jgi:Bacterial regulatory proteins, tetR family.
MAANPALAREDWIEAAMRALAAGGVEAVKVERLAPALEVSKGSFYWHFKDRGDLLRALLAHWESTETTRLIEEVAHLETPRARLEALARAALRRTDGDLNIADAEDAIRAWAAADPAARAEVRRVDERRVAYLEKELVAIGAGRDAALALARAVYLALIGLFAARRTSPPLADDGAFLHLVALAIAAAESDRS